jgi:ABC-type lipoprotein export system ATPase subunit
MIFNINQHYLNEKSKNARDKFGFVSQHFHFISEIAGAK